MSPFNMDDYVSVADRIAAFKKEFPEGSLQGEGELIRKGEDIVGYLYRARAYRTPEDLRPGVGTAFEPIPGATSYTRNSEVQNAETSAWGRAIVALGFKTKHIASADEVRAREDAPPAQDGDGKLSDAQMRLIGVWLNALQNGGEIKKINEIRTVQAQPPPPGYDSWVDYAKSYIAAHFDKRSRKDLTKAEAGVLIDHLEAMEIPFG